MIEESLDDVCVLIDLLVGGFEILKLFMGSERVFGGVGVRELEAGRESERTPVDKSKSLIQRGMMRIAPLLVLSLKLNY